MDNSLSKLEDALDGFHRTADQIVVSFLQTLKARGERELPKLIYHYTNDIGLKGIIESGQLWLTDVFSLNDPSELRYGLALAANELKSKADNGPLEHQRFADYFEEYCDKGLQDAAHFFTCSFSTNGNDLGQWRAYADNGRGYALGFDVEALNEIFKKEVRAYEGIVYAFPVTYEESEIVDIHNQLIDQVLSLISLANSLGETQIEKYENELLTQFTMHTLWASQFFKHKAYDNENEFRYLQMIRNDIPAPADMKWRHRPHELVKYREFTWRGLMPGVLKRIVIGPAADKDKATRFVSDCLKTFHDEDVVDVTHSGIPYRAV